MKSEIVSRTFLPSDFIANTISFGFAAQEASSVFLATPGQTFYAPVTLSILPNTTMYSLQFNITVTNSGPHPITPGAFAFRSRLVKPSTSTNLPSVTLYEAIPPYMFANYTTVTTNIVSYNGTNFINLSFANTNLNLIGVGWLERSGAGLTNLFNTGSQDLITYSIVHDTLFLKSSGKVIVGNYSFQVPTNSANGETYPIQIGRPSATSDGFGANGTDIYIFAPTNGSTGAGTIGALKYVTVTNSIKYLVGSVFPFRWWNAGDFGSSNLIAADVAQVFQSAVYNLYNPEFQAPGSDFMDAMDSAGNIGKLDSSSGYYTNSGPSPTGADPLFDSNDSTSINQVAFGDQKIDVADVFVTFRRSLDPSLTWFRRFRNNGIIVADTNAANVSAHVLTKSVATASSTIKSKVASTTPPQVSFTAGDVIGSAGQTVQIPITATILGSYPLRMLMLNLTVVPLDGSPAITTPVSFGQISAVLGAPYTTSSQGSGNYAAVWLNSTNAGLTGTAIIGNLNVTIPATASGSAAYAIHFDHASASPNGLASFKDQTLTGGHG